MDGKSYTLFELASLVGGEVVGDPDLVISGLCDIAEAEAGHLAFLTKAGRSQEIDETSASAVIVPLAVKQAGKTLLRVKDPNLAAAVIHQHFLRRPFAATGLHASAVVGADCKLPPEFSIGPQAVLGDRVTLGERVMVHAGVIIGNDVTIGADTILYPNVTVYDNSRIGARVIVHSGTVIGSDGFGYATDDKGRHLKRPHVGIVQIDDEVELGANVCIDRGTFGRTWIQQGAKIDNLVQIGHNVVVGAGCLIVSQVGIAGSATLGRGVILGGQAGIKGHIHLDDGVMVASKSGVHGSLSKGAVVAGYPAVPHREWLKTSALVGKLPQLHQELRDMKKAVAALREKLAGVDTTTP